MLFPREFVKNAGEIDLEKLWSEGKRGIICDIDNTLCRDEQFEVEPFAEEFIRKAKEKGFKICLMSNNGKARVEPVANYLNCEFHYKAHKPKREAYDTCLEKIGVSAENAIMIGDQLFTDILGANRVGLYSVLVEKIDKKEIIQIKLKRPFEKIVLLFYKHKK